MEVITKNRLEAFSDGVIAIIITIMVLELRPPHGTDLASLQPLLPVFLSYLLSFIYIGIYWNNHHHLLHAARQINGRIMWSNLHLLFWLSLIPFTTAWINENHGGYWPTAIYGVVLFFAAIAYFILSQSLVAHHGQGSVLAAAIGNDLKGKVSLVFYLAAIVLAFVNPFLANAIYVLVAVMWLMPDQRIEKALMK